MFQAKIKIQGNFVKNGYFHIFSCYLIVSKTVYISDILMLKKKKSPNRSSCCDAADQWCLCTIRMHSGLKDPVLLQLQLGSDPWPGRSTDHGAAKKEIKQKNPLI